VTINTNEAAVNASRTSRVGSAVMLDYPTSLVGAPDYLSVWCLSAA
jgi:hypothetical protein